MSAINPFRCSGCGKEAPDGVKSCDCVTASGSREGENGQREYTTLISPKMARRLALSDLIKTRLLGISPDDQDLVLEDHDWAEIVAALEGVPA